MKPPKLTRKQWTILAILATLDLLVMGGMVVIWRQTTARLSQPTATLSPTPVTQAGIVANIQTFIQDPELTPTPQELRSTAFGQKTRLYMGVLTTSNEQVRFEVNPETGEVTGFLRLGQPAGKINVDLDTAQTTAETFAKAHHPGFDPDTLPPTQSLPLEGDASPKIYVFRWTKQDPTSGALLPDTVTIQINAETGQVDAYESLRVPVRIVTQPRILEDQAHDIALKAVPDLNQATVKQTTLAVSTLPPRTPDGEQALLWRIVVEGKTDNNTSITILINAHTGDVVNVE